MMQRHMAEHVVKDVGLLDVVDLLGLADPEARRELAVGEKRKNARSGTSPGTATTSQPVAALRVVQDPEIRDAGLADAELVEASRNWSAMRLQKLTLAPREKAPRVMIGLGVGLQRNSRSTRWSRGILARVHGGASCFP